MKILFVTSSYAISDFRGGGISTYATEVVRCYSKNNEISVVICNTKQCDLIIPGIRTYHIHSFDNTFDSAQKLLNIVKVDEPEIIINSNVDLLSLILPYIPNDIKVISVCHSLGSLETETSGFHHRYTDMIIALSESAKEHIVKRFTINSNKITVIPNFVADLENVEEVIAKKKIITIPNIVFAGGGTGTKSPDLIAKVLKELLKTELNFNFWWLGGTLPPLHRLSCFRDITKLIPRDERVHFTGHIPYKEAQKLISLANIYLLPSRREGCPISLLEAMRSGAIPIVAEYNISNREIIRNGHNGFVINHSDVHSYVNVISDLIANSKEKSFLYDNSYDYFQKNLSYSVWENKMNTLLKIANMHELRDKELYKDKFLKDKRKLNCLLKMRRLQNFTKETLPAYFSMNMQYIIKHY